jgi:hypothetical protein
MGWRPSRNDGRGLFATSPCVHSPGRAVILKAQVVPQREYLDRVPGSLAFVGAKEELAGGKCGTYSLPLYGLAQGISLIALSPDEFGYIKQCAGELVAHCLSSHVEAQLDQAMH